MNQAPAPLRSRLGNRNPIPSRDRKGVGARLIHLHPTKQSNSFLLHWD